jgi:hypothetical protein
MLWIFTIWVAFWGASGVLFDIRHLGGAGWMVEEMTRGSTGDLHPTPPHPTPPNNEFISS